MGQWGLIPQEGESEDIGGSGEKLNTKRSNPGVAGKSWENVKSVHTHAIHTDVPGSHTSTNW